MAENCGETMRTEDFYISGWERFAGRPYTKPKTSPGLIRDTVKEAQELLCGLHYGKQRKTFLDFWSYNYFPPGNTEYPQSLGELSLEIHADRLRSAVKNGYSYWGWYSDVDLLRLSMYHK